VKKIAAIVFLIPALLFGTTLPSGNVNGHVRLAWAYPANELDTNLFFNFYATTNLTVPFAQWQFLTNTTGTNISIDLNLVPDRYFIVGTASNIWGETSITSNMVVLPFPPREINSSLKIQKLP
jgi:hypothetical protein